MVKDNPLIYTSKTPDDCIVYSFVRPDGLAFVRLSVSDDDDDIPFIHSLNTHVSARGNGYADKLLDFAEEYAAKQLGSNKTSLAVESGSWMKGWYRRRGYRQMTAPDDDGCVYMVKRLNTK